MSINECESHKGAKWIVANAAPHQINYSFDSHVFTQPRARCGLGYVRRVFATIHAIHVLTAVAAPVLFSILFPVDVWIYLAETWLEGSVYRTGNLLNLNLIFTLMESISLS